MAALVFVPLAGVTYYGWKAVTDAQQFDQKVDKVNPVVTAQNVALGDIDTRLLDSSVRKRHGMNVPEFFANVNYVNTAKGLKTFDRPVEADQMFNYNRAYLSNRKQKRMNPRGTRKLNTTSDEIVTTDMLARKLFKIDTSRWPY